MTNPDAKLTASSERENSNCGSDNLNTKAEQGHFTQLDGLRAFAAIAVLIQHSMPVSGINFGIIGVKLFFVRSGFVIRGILLRERRSYNRGVPLSKLLAVFYARRALRIFPLYYFTLFLGLVFQVPRLDQSLPWHLTYTTNFLVASYGDFDDNGPAYSHFWTLAIEEQFYLCWPFVLLLTPDRWLKSVLATIVILGPLSRACMLIAGYSSVTAKVITPSCFDSLGLGALVAVYFSVSPSRIRRVLLSSQIFWIVALPVLIVVGGSEITGKGYRPRLVLEDTAYSLLFAWLVGRGAMGFTGFAKRILEAKPMVTLGKISYGVYVYQGIIPVVLVACLGWRLPEYHSIGLLLLLPAVTIPVAMLSWYLVERPLNNLKKYIHYPPSYTPPPQAGPPGPKNSFIEL